jgi:hypothetical protein
MAPHPVSRRAALIASLLSTSILALPKGALAKKPDPPPIPPLQVSIAVAPDADDPKKPAQTDAWLDAQLAEAERLLGDAGVHFRKGPLRALKARFSRLETRKDRDALGALLSPGVINVFVVTSLRDVDDPSLLRMGVHWRPAKDLRKHYVIVAASARPSTLAHELGHFFGNGHSKVVNNLMSYDRDGGEVFLDAAQKRKIQVFARIYVRSKELLPAP